MQLPIFKSWDKENLKLQGCPLMHSRVFKKKNTWQMWKCRCEFECEPRIVIRGRTMGWQGDERHKMVCEKGMLYFMSQVALMERGNFLYIFLYLYSGEVAWWRNLAISLRIVKNIVFSTKVVALSFLQINLSLTNLFKTIF